MRVKSAEAEGRMTKIALSNVVTLSDVAGLLWRLTHVPSINTDEQMSDDMALRLMEVYGFASAEVACGKLYTAAGWLMTPHGQSTDGRG